jgi:urease accessory protein
MKNLRRLLIAALVALPAIAQAHPGHDGDHELTWDFNGGFLHPLTGWDHLLAMVAVGIWAAHLGGRARWLLPTAFLSAMIAGSTLAQATAALPAVEHGIAASLLALGLLIAFAVRLPALAGGALAALCALFHGAAHGAEMPAHTAAWSYGLGFVAATALLHVAGIALGSRLAQHAALSRTLGATIAAAGAVALAF